MRRKNLAVHFVAGMMCLAIGSVCDATTIQTTGAGSAVSPPTGQQHSIR